MVVSWLTCSFLARAALISAAVAQWLNGKSISILQWMGVSALNTIPWTQHHACCASVSNLRSLASEVLGCFLGGPFLRVGLARADRRAFLGGPFLRVGLARSDSESTGNHWKPLRF